MIGLIVNPASSKDIRRIVALGRVVPTEEKVNLVARFLAGIGGGPTVEVGALDDSAGVTRRAVEVAGRHGCPPISWLPVEARGTEADTVGAAEVLRRERVDLVAVVGGDGTLRAAVEGWPEAPLLLLPAGTNNAFTSPVEPTVAGLAAAHIEMPQVRDSALRRRLRLAVDGPAGATTAVVDVVGLSERWLAARAIWRPSDLIEGVVTRADPSSIGMVSVAAAFGDLADGHIRYLRFGSGHRVKVALGPGLVTEVEVEQVEDLPQGRRVSLSPETGVVALDGERRVMEGGDSHVTGLVGPWDFDPGLALAAVFGSRFRRWDLLP